MLQQMSTSEISPSLAEVVDQNRDEIGMNPQPVPPPLCDNHVPAVNENKITTESVPVVTTRGAEISSEGRNDHNLTDWSLHRMSLHRLIQSLKNPFGSPGAAGCTNEGSSAEEIFEAYVARRYSNQIHEWQSLCNPISPVMNDDGFWNDGSGTFARISYEGRNDHNPTDLAVVEDEVSAENEVQYLLARDYFLQPFALTRRISPVNLSGHTFNVPGEGEESRNRMVDVIHLIRRGFTLVTLTGNMVRGFMSRQPPGRNVEILVNPNVDLELGNLLAGSGFGYLETSITPTSDPFQTSIGDNGMQDVNSSGGRSPFPPSEENGSLKKIVVLFVISELFDSIFEIIYHESDIQAYFFACTGCCMIAAHLLARIEGGMASREQFAVYLRCFSFLLLELLQYWGIHQGNYATALKIVLGFMSKIIGWWVLGVLESYMNAFGLDRSLRRRQD